MTRRAHRSRPSRARGFTLVEILVVVTIIGILAGLLIPAIAIVIGRAKVGRIKMEISNLSTAVEAYRNEYGDYPPDFSDWGVVQRHFRSAFPRMAPAEMTLLGNLTGGGPVGIDRAEALVLTLGGYSSDPVHPLTGEGGPLEYIGDATGDPTSPTLYQYRADRSNSFFDFDVTRMMMTNMDPNASLSPSNKLASTDEITLGTGTANDVLPVYQSADGIAPYVYFDSRTYGFVASAGAFNGYGPQSGGVATADIGSVRPYRTNRPNPKAGTAAYGTPAAASKAFDFINPKTFQIISAGSDDRYGSIVGDGASPTYFLFPTGQAMVVDANATSPGAMLVSGVEGYQESSMMSSIVDNAHYDNVTNFAEGTLADAVEE